MSETISTDGPDEYGIEGKDRTVTDQFEIALPKTREEYEAWAIANGKLWPYDKRMRIVIGVVFFIGFFSLCSGAFFGHKSTYFNPDTPLSVSFYVVACICLSTSTLALLFMRKRSKVTYSWLRGTCVISIIVAIGLGIVFYSIEPSLVLVAVFCVALSLSYLTFAKKMGLSQDEEQSQQAKQAKKANNKDAFSSQTSAIDQVTYDEAKKKITLFLHDTESWYYESTHLASLSGSLEAYVSYYESGQYKAVIPDKKVQGLIIVIRFASPPTQKALGLLSDIEKKFKESVDIELCIQSGS